MILTTAAFLSGASIVLFVAGFVLSRPGVAMFGAILMIGVGAAGMSTGFQVATGEDVEQYEGSRTVPLQNISAAEYEGAFSVRDDSRDTGGVSLTQGGERMYTAGDRDDVVVEYEVADFDPQTAVTNGVFDVSAETTTPSGVSVTQNGTTMYVAGGSSLHQYELSEPYDVESTTHIASVNFGHQVSAVTTVDGGGAFAVSDATNATVYGYDMTGWDATTATQASTLDVSNRVGTAEGIGFGSGGGQLVIADASQDILFEYALALPYNVTGAVYTGRSVQLSNDATYASGVAINSDNSGMVVSSRDGSNLLDYSLQRTEPVNITNSRTTYEDISVYSGFPLGALVLLLGCVMLISGAGEASDDRRMGGLLRGDNK
jgi:hypothetical protein